ncbi:MAG: hypothetical protein NUW37_01745, partial [Planctomycetes bacterium]|nr:hypothetical protein [Planctomycetota bacterium]
LSHYVFDYLNIASRIRLNIAPDGAWAKLRDIEASALKICVNRNFLIPTEDVFRRTDTTILVYSDSNPPFFVVAAIVVFDGDHSGIFENRFRANKVDFVFLLVCVSLISIPSEE